MQETLFDHRTSKEKLLDFIRVRKVVKTSDCIKFASNNYSNRGDRDARQLAEEGKIKRMDEGRKKFLFPECREEIWELCVTESDYLK